MRQAKLMQVMGGAMVLTAWMGASALPAAAHDEHQGAKPGDACCQADQAPGHAAKPGDACCQDGHGAKPGDACCQEDKGAAKGGDCCAEGACDCDDKGGDKHGEHHEMHGHMDGHMGGPMGHHHEMMMGHDGHHGHMMGWKANTARGPEVRYMPAAWASAGGTNQYLVLGGGMEHPIAEHGVFSLGFAHNVAIQLFPNSATVGSWVAPYCGVVPRLGIDVGRAHLDVGVLGGFGVMGRTVSMAAAGAPNVTALDARLQWVVEPRVEIGMNGNEHGNLFLVGSYLFTPNPQDLGGAAVGLRATFKGHGW